MSLANLLNANMRGRSDGPPMVFVHGFGCGQEMWRYVAASFERDHRMILFDLPGSGNSDVSTFDQERHTSLDAYRDDTLRGAVRAQG